MRACLLRVLWRLVMALLAGIAVFGLLLGIAISLFRSDDDNENSPWEEP